jgi:hypothetical protein
VHPPRALGNGTACMNPGLALRAPIGLQTCLRHARPLQPAIARVSSSCRRPLQHIQQAGPVPRPIQEGAAAAAAAESQVSSCCLVWVPPCPSIMILTLLSSTLPGLSCSRLLLCPNVLWGPWGVLKGAGGGSQAIPVARHQCVEALWLAGLLDTAVTVHCVGRHPAVLSGLHFTGEAHHTQS